MWTGEYDDPMDKDKWLQKLPKELMSNYIDYFGKSFICSQLKSSGYGYLCCISCANGGYAIIS